MSTIKVTIWNEFKHEREQSPAGELIRQYYPDGLHRTLTSNFR